MFSALSQISKHTVELAELVVEAEVFPTMLNSLRDTDEYVRKNTATLIREIAKHTPEVKGNKGKKHTYFQGVQILLISTSKSIHLWLQKDQMTP